MQLLYVNSLLLRILKVVAAKVFLLAILHLISCV